MSAARVRQRLVSIVLWGALVAALAAVCSAFVSAKAASSAPTPPPDLPTRTPAFLPPPTGEPATQIQVGGAVDGVITGDTPDRYILFGAYQDTLSVGAYSKDGSALRPVLQIISPGGDVLAASRAGRIPAVFNITLPVSGAYLITVQASGTQTGAYTLFTARGPFLRDLEGGPLRLDQVIQGTLPQPGDRQRWTLTLRSGARFSVAARPAGGSTVDPVITVFSPDGKLLTTAHDLSDANAAQTGPISVPVAGDYRIYISAYQNASIGAYVMRIDGLNITPTSAPSRKTPQPVSIDVRAHVNPGERYTALFDGVQGQVVNIRAIADGDTPFDPIVEVFGPSGRRVAFNDDEADNSPNAALTVTLDDGDGVYTVKVSGYALMAGDFTLRVRSP